MEAIPIIDPKTKEISYNPRYEQLFAPEVSLTTFISRNIILKSISVFQRVLLCIL